MISKLLTIVIPTRNRLDFLEMTLQSVFERQTAIPDVIVSDNSTTDVPGMEALRARYPFRYVRRSGTLTMTEHHNACFDLPKTPWALLLHDDDELRAGVLAELELFLENCGESGLVIGGYERIDEMSVVKSSWIPEAGMLRGQEGVLRVGLDFQVHPPSTLYNVAAFRNVGGFPDALGASADFPLILGLIYRQGAHLFPAVIGRYRVGSHQATDFSPQGAERTMSQSIIMSNMTRATGLPDEVCDQLVDYNTWWIFRIIAAKLIATEPFFVRRLFIKCLQETPKTGRWKKQIELEYPILFTRLPWLSMLAYKITMNYLPAFIQRKVQGVGRSWQGGET